jgi:4a-hydroxytetrahydrobiopterin dehydratase
MSVTKLDPAAVAAGLAPLAPWRVDGDFITRTYRTGGWKGTLMVVNTVGHLCEAAWHHPDLVVGYNRVEVRLQTHDVGGVSARDLVLAAEIERVVTWRPEPGGPLEGIPDDPRFTYLVE